MKTKTSPLVGRLLIGTGIIHNAFGIIIGWNSLLEGIQAGLVGTWEETAARAILFWFLTAGSALIAMGLLTAHIERTSGPLPWAFIIALAVIATTGVITMPASGFWLLLATTTIAAFRRMHSH